MLPEPGRAPAGSGDEDSWGWLVTFSDLVLQLFGFAVIAAVGGATAHQVVKSATPPVAIALPAPAAHEREVAPARPVRRQEADRETAPNEVQQITARPAREITVPPAQADPATIDHDALPARARDEDRLPPAPRPAAAASRTDAAPAARTSGDPDLQAIGRYLEQLAGRERGLAANVSTRSGEVVVEIGAIDGFAPGSAEPVPAMRPLLAELRALVAASARLHVEISGHTDDVPIRSGRFPSNLELSLARASRIAQELSAGDAPLRSRISAAGHGEQRPVASNADIGGRARNRRVEIRLTRLD